MRIIEFRICFGVPFASYFPNRLDRLQIMHQNRDIMSVSKFKTKLNILFSQHFRPRKSYLFRKLNIIFNDILVNPDALVWAHKEFNAIWISELTMWCDVMWWNEIMTCQMMLLWKVQLRDFISVICVWMWMFFPLFLWYRFVYEPKLETYRVRGIFTIRLVLPRFVVVQLF